MLSWIREAGLGSPQGCGKHQHSGHPAMGTESSLGCSVYLGSNLQTLKEAASAPNTLATLVPTPQLPSFPALACLGLNLSPQTGAPGSAKSWSPAEAAFGYLNSQQVLLTNRKSRLVDDSSLCQTDKPGFPAGPSWVALDKLLAFSEPSLLNL